MKDHDLTRGVWFGPPATAATRRELAAAATAAGSNYDRAIAATELLKLGNFSARRQLLDAMSGADVKLRNACCAVYCATARHDDIGLLMEALDPAAESDVKAFALYGSHTLSLHTVPYLLALLETWEGTSLEQKLGDALQALFPPDDNRASTFEALREFYGGLADRFDPAVYYLWGKPAFAGDLTRRLITLAAEAKRLGKPLEAFEVPMLLSVWCGLECPVSFASVIDDTTMGRILAYVKSIASMEWRRGGKYFYGHAVE
jgi:hypothetical protein